MSDTMTQEAPFPLDLAAIVDGLQYKPGWQFHLVHMDRGQGSTGLTLDIVTLGYNAYHPEQGQHYAVHHYMIVPAAAYDYRSWRRWVFEQIVLVETHEAMEFFQVDGDHPFAPSHGPGNDPYLLREIGTEEDRRTSFRGDLNPQ